MPLYSSANRDAMAAWCERELFNLDCDILRESRSITSSGGSTSTWPVEATVRCVMVNMLRAPQERALAVQETGIMYKIIGFPLGTDVRKDDRLRIGGVILYVIDLYSPASYEVMTTALVQRTTLP